MFCPGQRHNCSSFLWYDDMRFYVWTVLASLERGDNGFQGALQIEICSSQICANESVRRTLHACLTGNGNQMTAPPQKTLKQTPTHSFNNCKSSVDTPFWFRGFSISFWKRNMNDHFENKTWTGAPVWETSSGMFRQFGPQTHECYR